MKKTIKGLLIFMLIASMLFVLTGCGDKETAKKEDKEETVEQKQETNIEQEEKTEFSMGEWNNNVYTNDFLGLKFNLPDGWTYSSDEELEETNKQMAEQNGVGYVTAMDPNTGNNINIFSEKPAIDITTEVYINQLKTKLSAVETVTYEIGETSKEEFAGRECDTLEMTTTMYGVKVTQKYYIYKIDKYIIGIIATSLDGETGINEIIECFE